MSIFESILLGLVQGLTEFLPVSSSAHLIIIPKILGFLPSPLVFDTSLHIGTTLAVILFFFKDITKLTKKELIYIGAASVPVLGFGFLFDNLIESVFRDLKFVVLFLFIGTLIMFFAEMYIKQAVKKSKEFKDDLSLKKVLIVGSAQILALFPGISRSGVTISTAIFSGFSREKAARVSFLLSIPATLAAACYQLLKTYSLVSQIGYAPFLMGILTSFISGIFAISFLLKMLRTKNMMPFVVYRLVLVLMMLIVVSI